MSKKRILILGGGYAGVKAGKTLHKAFKKDDTIEITLIDRHRFHTLMTELHEVAGHRTEPDAIRVDLFKIFAGRKVNVVVDEIIGLDFEKQQLISKDSTYEYDYLILGTGNESNFFGTEGADEFTHTLWSYEDAVKLRHHVEKMYELASVESNKEERKKLLTFAVCGGGFTGVEMVGELGEAKVHLSKKYGIDPKEVSIYNIEALNRILNMLKDDKQIKKVEKRYEKLGVKLLKNSPITKVEEDCFTLKDGTNVPTYTLIWTAGIKNNTWAAKLGLQTGRGGRILVNEFMQSLDFKNVFVVGDNASYQDEENGPMPQIVEAAEQSGHTAATNIAALIENNTLQHKHKQNYHGFMVSVGSRYAVAETGFKSSGWFAQLIKHFVNFFYLFMVSGLRQLWNYCRHEFFHVKNRRSFVGGHFSKSSQNIWRLPLRVWLGYMWLVEGLVKISEGWLKEGKVVATINALAGSTAGTDGGTAATAAAEGAAEAVTAATGAVTEGATEVISNIPVWAQWAVNHKPAGYGEALMHAPKWMVDMVNNWIAPIEVPFQTFMVVAEILIGLSLIFGLFTFLSSFVSVGMGFGIIFTGMADLSMIWYICCAIALIPGSGSSLGLDYYVLPHIKNWWLKTKFARKSYLYFDHFEES